MSALEFAMLKDNGSMRPKKARPLSKEKLRPSSTMGQLSSSNWLPEMSADHIPTKMLILWYTPSLQCWDIQESPQLNNTLTTVWLNLWLSEMCASKPKKENEKWSALINLSYAFVKNNLIKERCINISSVVLIVIIMEEFYRRKYLSPTYSRPSYTDTL